MARADDSFGHALVTLDTTRDTIREAEEVGADVIVEHHPLFFVSCSGIDASGEAPDPAGEYAARLIREGISVYASHTSFDSSDGGMNDILAHALGLEEIERFPAGKSADGKFQAGMGRKGVVRGLKRTFGDFIAEAEELFGMKGRLRTIGDTGRDVSSVAICGGAGGGLIPDAIREGVDLYITADVKHHEARWAREKGLLLIDGGHHGTEKIFTRVMAGLLRNRFEDALEVTESLVERDPWE
jgi:dinuclear metal center YbgI/SA1388 family protein